MLWDMDGTLADSRDYHWLSWQEALAAEGVRITREQFDASFGQRNAEILAGWLGPDAGAERIEALGDAKERAYRTLLRQGGLEPLPGAATWLRALRDAGWRQAIASSAPRANIEVMVGVLGFRDLIDTWLGAEDVSRGKPDPEVFLNAARRLDVASERCVVVEDAEAGVEAAKRAGMCCVGVAGAGAGTADLVVASLEELPPGAFDALIADAPD